MNTPSKTLSKRPIRLWISAYLGLATLLAAAALSAQGWGLSAYLHESTRKAGAATILVVGVSALVQLAVGASFTVPFYAVIVLAAAGTMALRRHPGHDAATA